MKSVSLKEMHVFLERDLGTLKSRRTKNAKFKLSELASTVLGKQSEVFARHFAPRSSV